MSSVTHTHTSTILSWRTSLSIYQNISLIDTGISEDTCFRILISDMDSNGDTMFLVFVIASVSFCALFRTGVADTPIDYICNANGSNTKDSLFSKNTQSVLDDLVKASSQAAGSATSEFGESPNIAYGFIQCRGDTTSEQCYNCSVDAASAIQQYCGSATGGLVWFDDCFLRVQNSSFFGQLDVNDNHSVYRVNTQNITSDTGLFHDRVQRLLSNLSAIVIQSSSTLFASGRNDSVDPVLYGLVQCWKGLATADCQTCFIHVLDMIYKGYGIPSIRWRTGGRILTASCMGRYETYKFYREAAYSSPPEPHRNNLPLILGLSAASVLVLIAGFSFLLLRNSRRRKRKETPRWDISELEEEDLTNDNQIMLFSMQELMAATNNFDKDLKLGQGGFGVVYKGILANGREVAVKKLSLKSTQGEKEFINEIRVVANVQHRNLINLVGCCVEKSERIVVYEYLSNKSLDVILFDSKKREVLDWNKRYNIIVGIAKGLLYLHEGSNLKIIHRDIKASNILLDNDFNPKIADFGVARLFSEDESHILTRVVGTFGYMAPEYAMQGQLSAKADVYSFGVLLIEITSGKRSNGVGTTMNNQSLLGWAWGLYQQGKIADIVDEAVRESCNNLEEVFRTIHVAFLCTQEDVCLRPPMSAALLMLSSASVTLSNPTKPAFVSSNQSSGYASNYGNQSLSSNGRNSDTPSPPSRTVSHATVSLSHVLPR